MGKAANPAENARRPRKMYAPCGPYELYEAGGMDVWVKPKAGRRAPVIVIPLPTTPAQRKALIERVKEIVYCYELTYGSCSMTKAETAFEAAAERVLIHLGLLPKPRQ